MKQLFSFLFFCSLLYSSSSWAQATFNNPYSTPNSGQPANAYDVDGKRIDDPSGPVIIKQGVSQSKTYSIVLWRNRNAPVSGSVKLFYGGTSATSIATNIILATTTVNGNSNWSYDPGSAQERLSISGSISLSATDASPYKAIYAVFYSGTSTSPTEISHPVYIEVQTPPTGGGSTNPTTAYAVSYYKNVGEAGSSIQLYYEGTNLDKTVGAAFNGSNINYTYVAGSSTSNSTLTSSYFTLPKKGDYTIGIAASNSQVIQKTFHVVTPLATFFPCSSASNSSEICSSQCITAGSTPALLLGRVIATSSSEYDDYNNTYYWEHNGSNVGQFGSTGEQEQVQWQYSWNNSDWSDVTGGTVTGSTGRNYQPGALQRTTFFRRVSTHIEGRLGHRAYWYTSATVTVSVQGKPPVPFANPYNVSSCGNAGQTIEVAVDKDYDNTYTNKSYNWRLPYSGWTVNGYSTVNSGNPYNTNNGNVSVFVPAGTAPGTYYLLVSGIGDCGTESGSTYISFNVSQDPIDAPSSIRFDQNANTSKCTWWYDATCPIVPGATSYSANGVPGQIFPSSGLVYFPLNYIGGQDVTISVTASNACGTGPAFTTTEYLNQASPDCDDNNITIYPNPTSAGVKLSNGGLEGQATFYDAQGVARKVIALHKKQVETDINLLDLPNGTYHVQITSNGKTNFNKQLIVQH